MSGRAASSGFLPVCRADLERRGWAEVDIVLVSGDAYIDHPSFGVALIGRHLEDLGFRVGIIAQPDWRSKEAFTALGRPRLFFGISSGNVDSMVANYTGGRRPRPRDGASPGRRTDLRPDRALIVYANRVREAFPGATVVLGGLEASLRRLAHYDYWDDAVRRSILLDAKADVLVYGMGEAAAAEIAVRLARGGIAESLEGIRGTAVARRRPLPECLILPSYEETREDKEAFNQAFRLCLENLDPFTAKPLAQAHGDRWLIQFPPAPPLPAPELDRLYELPYRREAHPRHSAQGGLKAVETVRFSLTSHRGCCGACSFCSLSVHQGRIVSSRSAESLLREARAMAGRPDFKGTITDVGGPTANLYAASCPTWSGKGACRRSGCLAPEPCRRLKLGYAEALSLYRRLKRIPGVKHVFVASGLRYDLLTDGPGEAYLEELLRNHISGRMKVASEHVSDQVLRLMNKPPHAAFQRFLRVFERINRRLKRRSYLVNYLISAHPGSSCREALDLALYLLKGGIHPEQIQDYLPLPMTLSACLYHTHRHPLTGEEVYVATSIRERKRQRALIQYRNPGNLRLIAETLKEMGLSRLLPRFQARRIVTRRPGRD